MQNRIHFHSRTRGTVSCVGTFCNVSVRATTHLSRYSTAHSPCDDPKPFSFLFVEIEAKEMIDQINYKNKTS